MKAKRVFATALIAGSALLGGMGGCPRPSADSLLEGTWKVAPSEGFPGRNPGR